MKRLTLISILLLPIGSQLHAQPDIFRFVPGYSIPIDENNFIKYSLYDINGDSCLDITYTIRHPYDYDFVYFANGVDGAILRDSIALPINSGPTLYYDSSNNDFSVYFAHCVRFDTLITFSVKHFNLENPSIIDSILVTATNELYFIGGFGAVKSIERFDIGSDGVEDLVLFWGYWEGRVEDLGQYNKGRLIGFDRTGNLIIDARDVCESIITSKFEYDGRQYLLHWGKYKWYRHPHSLPSEEIKYKNFYIFNDTLSSISALRADYYDNTGVRVLTEDSGNLISFLRIWDWQVAKYSSPLVLPGQVRYLPGNAVACYYIKNNTQYILTGCQSNYFELRDLDMNLVAFIWGPSNLNIQEINSIDTDFDGTDELICLKLGSFYPNGFVLYRLDTTSVAIDDDIAPLPGDFALSAYPNPFNSEVTFSLSGTGGRPVPVGIYDINGRQVRGLLALDGRAVWDGRDDRGEVASSGVYFVRAAMGGKTAMGKVVLLK